MKKHYIYIIGIAAALFTACENISEDERFLEVEGVTAQRVVLLEDYTGQGCLNCPNAHDVATQLHEAYHDNLIVVSMHAGMLAYPYPDGLKQPEGDAYATAVGVEFYPSGMVNRRGGLLDNYLSWSGAVYNELQRESQIQLTVNANLSSDSILSVNVDMIALAAISGKLQLWIVEDSIIAMQKLPTGKYDPKYVHNHVFRGAINGTWGEDISLTLGEEKTKCHNDFELNAAWKPENLSVVAFVYNDNDGVLQAAQCNVNLGNIDE